MTVGGSACLQENTYIRIFTSFDSYLRIVQPGGYLLKISCLILHPSWPIHIHIKILPFCAGMSDWIGYYGHLETSSVRLALLLRLTQAFSSTLDLDEVLNRVMDEVLAVLHAERASSR